MKTALGLAVGLLITTSLADDRVSSVAFVLGPKHFSGGNAITIEQVAAASPRALPPKNWTQFAGFERNDV
jgi:hypothetical protein